METRRLYFFAEVINNGIAWGIELLCTAAIPLYIIRTAPSTSFDKIDLGAALLGGQP